IAGGIYMVRSVDGGTNWTFINTYDFNGYHPDVHSFAFDPTTPNRFYMTSDGGVHRSEDGGASYTDVSDGLAITQAWDIAIDQSVPDKTYLGTQDNGAVLNTSNNFGEIAGGEIVRGVQHRPVVL